MENETEKDLQPSYSVTFFFLLQGSALAEDIKMPAPIGDIYVQDFAKILTEEKYRK